MWNFCGGWNPAALGAAAAFYGIDDIDAVIDQLLAIRDCVDQHRAEQMNAGGQHGI